MNGASFTLINDLKIATFDKKDGITKIYDKSMDTKTGEKILYLVQNGSDTGIPTDFRINHDYLLNSPLVKGKEYWYAISSYYYNENSGNHFKTVESFKNSKRIIFQENVNGFSFGDTLKVGNNSEDINEILVQPFVVNPLKLTDHTYQVSLQNIDNKVIWELTNLTLNEVVLTKQKIIDRNFYNAAINFQLNPEIPIVDGLLLVVSYRERTLGNFKSSGISLVKYSGKNIEQSNPKVVWSYFSRKVNGEDHFSINSALSNGNIENLYIDAKYLLPYDYELRFTEKENFAIDYWNNNRIISVPFELWNIGVDTPNDFSDDIRMIPFIKMQKDTNYWSINSSFERLSYFFQGNAKPASDWIYWMKPDVVSGGYNSFSNICQTVGVGGEYDTIMDNSTQGFYTDFQAGFNYVMGNMIIVDCDKDGNPPPAETTIRFSTLKPVHEDITFIFTSVKPTAKISPNKFTVFQNYPNPFNPLTTIRFFLPEDGNIKLTLYNILGQEVKELINKEMLAGKYEVPFDGSNLASGVYIYRLESNNLVETCKMILLK